MADGPGVALPLVGKVSRKWLIIVGVASAGSIGYFAWKRRQSAAAAATTSTDTSATDSSGQIDPLTGDVAGSEQDQMDLAALQDESAYGSGAGSTLGDYGGYLAASPAAASIPGAGGFTTNAEWAQQAESDLGGLGVNQVTLAAALGKYLTGQPLSAAQQGLVDQAIAEEGYPPVSGPGGYPPGLKSSPTGGGSGTGGSGGRGVSLDQAHEISHAQADQLLREDGDVYYKAADGSYVKVTRTAGTGQLYTGARGWAKLHHGK